MTSRRRRCAALLAVPLLAAPAGCTSSGGAAQSPSGAPTDAAALQTELRTAIAPIRSAHIELDIDLAGQQLTGAGAEKLDHGRLTALDLTEQLPAGAGSVRVIRVGDTTYARLPVTLNRTGAPWLLVTPSSSNPVIGELAPSLDSAVSVVSMDSLSALVGAADSVEAKGQTTIDGIPTTHYAVRAEVAKLPASLPGRAQLVASGQPTVSVELYVDGDGRPVRAERDLSVQGQDATFTVTYRAFGAPVTVTAPPAGQVGS